ncbi:MAG: transposase [Desulfobacteraceae bacterium]|nr:transposase [Desulfobacteraceae bacterium]
MVINIKTIARLLRITKKEALSFCIEVHNHCHSSVSIYDMADAIRMHLITFPNIKPTPQNIVDILNCLNQCRPDGTTLREAVQNLEDTSFVVTFSMPINGEKIQGRIKARSLEGLASGIAPSVAAARNLDIQLEILKIKAVLQPQPSLTVRTSQADTQEDWWYLQLKDSTSPKGPRINDTKVVGVKFENRQEIIAKLQKGEHIFLRREPGNHYDKNAIRVERLNGEQIGYLSRHLAGSIASVFDEYGKPMKCTPKLGQIAKGSYHVHERSASMAKRRRKYSPEFKAQVVLEVLSGFKSGAEVCREYGIRSQLLSKWKAQFLENAVSVFEEQSQAPAEDKARIAELERLAGRQALEIEVLKKASSILRSHRSGSEK